MHLSGVILSNTNGEILLIHRATDRRTQWEIPGGKIEAHEEPAGAAAREALEELGTEVKIIRELGSESFDEDGHRISTRGSSERSTMVIQKSVSQISMTISDTGLRNP